MIALKALVQDMCAGNDVACADALVNKIDGFMKPQESTPLIKEHSEASVQTSQNAPHGGTRKMGLIKTLVDTICTCNDVVCANTVAKKIDILMESHDSKKLIQEHNQAVSAQTS